MITLSEAVAEDERRQRTDVRTATTNAGSLRTGDVLAVGAAGLVVRVLESDGTEVITRTRSLRTGAVQLRHFPAAVTVRIVHPDDHGRQLAATTGQTSTRPRAQGETAQ